MYDLAHEELEIEYWSRYDYLAELAAEHEDRFYDEQYIDQELLDAACSAHVFDYYAHVRNTVIPNAIANIDDDIPF